MLKKIISGGQTGVDRAALDVGLAMGKSLGITVGGHCPKGRIAEDGVISPSYPLAETPSEEYSERTLYNVRNSDGTLILARGILTTGTAFTLEAAKQESKPYFIVNLAETTDQKALIKWLKEENIATLNVAGPRESSAPKIYQQAYNFLKELLKENLNQ